MDPVTPSQGWGVLHLFMAVTPEADGAAISKAVTACVGDNHQVVSFAVLGHKADLGFMALGPDLWRLRRLQAGLQQAGLVPIDSYVSLTEVSEYAKGMPDEMLQSRLYPQLPPEGKAAMCFYPMSKKRDAHANWYELPYDDRRQLMMGHGAKGREFAGQVVQIITGSTGLDDWEWGVTLFASDPVMLKQVVYEMRFDVASARYAEFGEFVTCLVAPIDELIGQLIEQVVV